MTTQEQIRNDWNKIAAGYDRFVTPTHISIAAEGLHNAELRPGMRFLDVASGSGALSIPAARLGANVLSVDISSVMLERLKARAKKEGLSVETRVMDGHSLELEDDTFDITGSQFGVMLFPDMPSGLSEMARVTKPGGRVLMHVLGPPEKVEFFSFFVRAIQAALPGFTPPKDPPPLPFQLRNPERLYQEMVKAGLKEVNVETITEKLSFQSGKELWEWLLNSNPVAQQLIAGLSMSERQKEIIHESLDLMIRERAVGSDVAILMNQIHRGIGKK